MRVYALHLSYSGTLIRRRTRQDEAETFDQGRAREATQMKFGPSNVQTHNTPFLGATRRAPPRYKIRWPLLLCIGFSLAVWAALIFGAIAISR